MTIARNDQRASTVTPVRQDRGRSAVALTKIEPESVADATRPQVGKLIAVHSNYRSRALERGYISSTPSYFMKPGSTVSPGGELVQPQGTELAAFEGEVALIIGTPARNVTPESAAEHIGWYAAANDFGVHDFRWADRGSNVRSKGQDGFTPMGDWLPADSIKPDDLRLRTIVNGETRQDSDGDDLLFSYAQLIADLSRFMTLERGDVILTGTPAGAGAVGPGDTIVVEVEAPGSRVSTVTSTVVEAPEPTRAYGAMPRATTEARRIVHGKASTRPMTLRSDTFAALHQVSTATLAAQLGLNGLAPTLLSGLRASRKGLRMVGYAHTLRYVAARADIRAAREGEESLQRRGVESVMPGDVLIIEARGVTAAATLGATLAEQVLERGGAGIVTDGGLQDAEAVGELGIPTYFRSPASGSLWLEHIPLEIEKPITCAGHLVIPGDVVVGDSQGVVVLPAALAERIAHNAYEQEQERGNG